MSIYEVTATASVDACGYMEAVDRFFPELDRDRVRMDVALEGENLLSTRMFGVETRRFDVATCTAFEANSPYEARDKMVGSLEAHRMWRFAVTDTVTGEIRKVEGADVRTASGEIQAVLSLREVNRRSFGFA